MNAPMQDGHYLAVELSTEYCFAPKEEYIGGAQVLSAGILHSEGGKAKMLREIKQMHGDAGGNDADGYTYVRGMDEHLNLRAYGNCFYENMEDAALELPYGYEVYYWINDELMETFDITEGDIYEP